MLYLYTSYLVVHLILMVCCSAALFAGVVDCQFLYPSSVKYSTYQLFLIVAYASVYTA